MQTCSYCGHENEDAAPSCGGCGTSLIEPTEPVPLQSPSRMAAGILQTIWERLAVKRGQVYLAGFLIGGVGAFLAALRGAVHGMDWWSFPVGGAFGAGAVWLLVVAEKLQARIRQARADGNPTGALQVLFVIFGLLALLIVAALVAGIAAFFASAKVG